MHSSFLQVRPVAEDEMFKVVRTGKRKSKYHIYLSKVNIQLRFFNFFVLFTLLVSLD